jgi:hypothetical protein
MIGFLCNSHVILLLIQMVNKLRVSKRKRVLVQAAVVLHVTETSRLKSKQEMWTKNWKIEKYKLKSSATSVTIEGKHS